MKPSKKRNETNTNPQQLQELEREDLKHAAGGYWGGYGGGWGGGYGGGWGGGWGGGGYGGGWGGGGGYASWGGCCDNNIMWG